MTTVDASESETPAATGVLASWQRNAAVLALLVGNLAGILGSIKEIRDAFVGLLGIHTFQFLDSGLTAIVGALLVFGYGAILFIMVRSAADATHQRVLTALGSSLFLVVLFVNSYFVIPRAVVDWQKIADSEITQWVQEGFALQKPNGGFRIRFDQPQEMTQVWTTAQYLTGIMQSGQEFTSEQHRAIRSAFDYMDRVRNQEGGWGYTDELSWAVTEVSAWVSLAYIQALDYNHVDEIWPPAEQREIALRLQNQLDFLAARQLPDGSFSVIGATPCGRTYSTVMALWALTEARRQAVTRVMIPHRYDRQILNAAQWLLQSYEPTLGWRTFPGAARDRTHVGLTAQALYVLGLVNEQYPLFRNDARLLAAEDSFFSRTKELQARDVSFNSQTNDSEVYSCHAPGVVLEGSTFLWFPWSLALSVQVASSAHAPDDLRKRAGEMESTLIPRIKSFARYSRTDFSYVAAEGLVTVASLRLSDDG